MKPTINISLRVPAPQSRYLKRAAKLVSTPLATYVRDAAVLRAIEDLHKARDPLVTPKPAA